MKKYLQWCCALIRLRGRSSSSQGVMEAAESALAQTGCAEGPPVAMESPQVPLPRPTLELVKQVAHVKLLLWDAQESCELPRGVTVTQQCAHCRAVLQHYWIDNAKGHSSVSLPQRPGQSAFCFCLWDPWQIKTRLSVLAERPYLPAGYEIPWQRLPVLCSNSHPAHPAVLCPPWESSGWNHSFQLRGKLRGIALLTAKIKCNSEIRTATFWFYR